jgi:hypothetical protein
MRSSNDFDATAVLCRWYSGEVGGEALFCELAARAGVEHAGKWRVLARLEARVAARLRHELSMVDCPLPVANHVQDRASARCDAIEGRSWMETMQWLQLIASEALERMKIEAASLPERFSHLGDLIVQHEQALLSFATLELDGGGRDSLQAIEAVGIPGASARFWPLR